jgi:hypothetical protein
MRRITTLIGATMLVVVLATGVLPANAQPYDAGPTG